MQNKSKKEKGIDKIKSAIPTLKIVTLESYKRYCEYLFKNLATLLEFYNYKATQGQILLVSRPPKSPCFID